MATSMLRRIFAVFLIAAVAVPVSVRAQDAAAPFDGDLLRLAEILGTLHYLRGICGANEGQKWRAEMQALVDAETPSGARRSRMIASFNRGYNGFQQTYRTCTRPRRLAIRRYLEEGSKNFARSDGPIRELIPFLQMVAHPPQRTELSDKLIACR